MKCTSTAESRDASARRSAHVTVFGQGAVARLGYPLWTKKDLAWGIHRSSYFVIFTNDYIFEDIPLHYNMDAPSVITSFIKISPHQEEQY